MAKSHFKKRKEFPLRENNKMKRFLSLFLVLATLLCAIPVLGTAAMAETKAAGASDKGLGDYRDLYVKEGLVALFTAYEATASSTAPTTWTPADYYGKKGYDDYLAPAAYALYDNTSYFGWKWVNGALASYRQSTNGTSGDSANFYFNLDTLGAAIGTTYSVQTITQITDMKQKRPAPTVEVDASGSYIITNYSSFSGKGTETTNIYFGPLTVKVLGYNKYSGSNDPVISAHFYQFAYTGSTGSSGTLNVFFNKSQYFADATKRTYYYMNGETKTSIGSAVLGNFPWGVMEQTVSRMGDGTPTADGARTGIPYRLAWQFMPSKYGGSGATASQKDLTTYVTADKTILRPISNNVQNVFSIRVYNTVLDRDALNRNHFADLLGYFGTNTDRLLTLTEKHLDMIVPKFANTVLYHEKYDASGALTAGFLAAKAAFETALEEAVKEAEAAFVAPTEYDLLYVKDGLVALFSAFNAKASDEALTAWTAVDFEGKDGYDDYLLPLSYTLNGTWTAKNGSYATATNAYFSLNSLVTAMGEAADAEYPNYTVQEVFNFTASPTTPAVYSKDAAGDYIVENYATLNGIGTNNKASTYGAIVVNFGFYSKAYNPNNVWILNNYLVQIQYHNNSSYTYKNNVIIANDYYGGEKAVYYYMKDETTTDPDTGETVTTPTKTALASGAAIYASRYPSSIWEQTVSRTLDTDATTEDSVVFNHRVAWQFKPAKLNTGSYTGKGWNFSTTNNASLTIFNTLTVHNGKNANVYSTRVYNRALTDAELDRNHLADLCAYYGADVTALLAMDNNQLALVAAEMADVALYKEKYDANGNLTAAFKREKRAFEVELTTLIGAVLTDGTASYVDLYVKDGLAALFTAYESKSTDAAPTAWAPVSLYGVEGYEDYIDPTTYTYALTGTWTAGNGAYVSNGSGTAFNLSTLGAKIGTTWSVQTVFNLISVNNTSASTLAQIEKVEIDNEDGTDEVKNVVTNYTSLSKWAASSGFESGLSTYGPMTANLYAVPSYYKTNEALLGGAWFIQLGGKKADGTDNSYTNVFFCSANYGMKNDTFYYTKADGTEVSFAAWTASFPNPVVEQTVARLGDGVVGSATTAFSWRFTYQFNPTRKGSNPLSARSFTHTSYALADSTSLNLLVGKKANNYSVRVYTKDLSLAEIDRNHFADLCAYYGIAVNGLGTVSDAAIAKLAATYATTALKTDIYDENGAYTDSYYETKIGIQNAVNTIVGEENTSNDAALGNLMAFDGHSFRASGDYGIRALFTLDKVNLARLEGRGMALLNYGAIMAIGKYNGSVYNENAASLTLTADADGNVVLSDGIAGARVVQSVEANFKTLSDDEIATKFAYTTTYPVLSDAAIFSIDMLYRAFAVVQDEDGKISVHYYDLTEEEETKNSLFELHKNVIADYGRYHAQGFGMGSFDYLYDVLERVDSTAYNAEAREAARKLAEENYDFDEENIVFTFGAMSDVHVVNTARGNRMANMMKVFQNVYGAEAILFAGDITDKLNGPSYATDAGFLAGYKELVNFANYASVGNVNNVPLIWALGNHERPNMTNANPVTFSANGKNFTIAAGTTVSDGFYSVMESYTDTFMDPTAGAPTGFRYQNVGGYAFFAIDYTFANAETIKWLDEQLTQQERLHPNKPIFVTSHMPATHSAQIPAITQCLEKHKNVIYFSGHTHVHMQTYSSVTQHDGFVELVLGPGSHGNYGVSGPGYDYCSYEMKQGAVIDVDAQGNVRIRCVDMNFNVEEDGTITPLFTKGGNDQLGTIAENPYVLRTAYISYPTKDADIALAYDSIPRSTEDERYEAPAFKNDAVLGVSDVTADSLKLLIPKASATNVIKYYKITAKDANGNTVKILDALDSAFSGTNPKASLVSELLIGSDHICYVPYNVNYPDIYQYTLKTSYTLTKKDADGNVVSTDGPIYIFTPGETYTISVTAVDDYGTATKTISTTFTVPAE